MSMIDAIKNKLWPKEAEKPVVKYACKKHGEDTASIRFGANGTRICLRCVAEAFPMEEIK